MKLETGTVTVTVVGVTPLVMKRWSEKTDQPAEYYERRDSIERDRRHCAKRFLADRKDRG